MRVLTGKEPIRSSDELPWPKSSMVKRTPEPAQAVDVVRGRTARVEDDPVGDLELEERGVDPGVARACAPRCRRRSGLARSREARLTDRRSGSRSVVLPGPQLAARLPQHPVVEGDDEVALLGHGDELGRLEDPEGRVVPPDQGLDAHDLGGAQVDVGLVDEEELVAVEGRDQVVVELAVVDRPAARVGRVGRAVEHLEGVAAVVLGPVHGLVGPVEQVVVAVAVLGGDGDPDRRRGRSPPRRRCRTGCAWRRACARPAG